MAAPLDMHHLQDRLVRELRLGAATARELVRRLGVSQPTVSRLVRRAGADVLVAGRGRSTRYAARRRVEDVSAPIPVFEVGAAGTRPRHLLDLHPVRPDGTFVEAREGGAWELHDDLPWFLHDLRPTGYLGRLLPRRHPELGHPADVGLWGNDAVLRYVVRHGWNLPGALIVGEPAFSAFLASADDPPDRVDRADRAARYPEIAADLLAWGPAGSSAAGEHPKFLATRDDGAALVPVLVKFAPPRGAVARRTTDLLVAEHVAHEVLAANGVPSARSSLLEAGGRRFLEVERFDRDGAAHRRGVISLAAVEAQHVGGPLDRWSTTTAALVGLGLLSADDHRRVRWLEAFGGWIANTDMHSANLSFWLDGVRVTGVAPAYDVLPMLYSPRGGELVELSFAPPLPRPADRDVAPSAWRAALQFWRAVCARDDVSRGFRRIASANAEAVARLESAIARLPT